MQNCSVTIILGREKNAIVASIFCVGLVNNINSYWLNVRDASCALVQDFLLSAGVDVTKQFD